MRVETVDYERLDNITLRFECITVFIVVTRIECVKADECKQLAIAVEAVASSLLMIDR